MVGGSLVGSTPVFLVCLEFKYYVCLVVFPKVPIAVFILRRSSFDCTTRNLPFGSRRSTSTLVPIDFTCGYMRGFARVLTWLRFRTEIERVINAHNLYRGLHRGDTGSRRDVKSIYYSTKRRGIVPCMGFVSVRLNRNHGVLCPVCARGAQP